MPRLPRFRRASNIAPLKLTERDREIVKLVHQHRFLRSSQIIALVNGSSQQVLRRLQLLYHHRYLDRPRAQLEYFERGGSRGIVYGLSTKGAMLMRELSWKHRPSDNDKAVGRIFLDHALLVSDIMVGIELACRANENVRLLSEDQIPGLGQKHGFKWYVKIQNGHKIGAIPDRVFALEYTVNGAEKQCVHFFLEADRGTMPVQRKNLIQTSFYRKILAYHATWTQRVASKALGIRRFRVLTVTTSPARVKSLVEACSQLKKGHGLFLFADRTILSKNILTATWQTGKLGITSTVLD